MQRYILIDGHKIKQPNRFNPSWATTYTEDSGRAMKGKAFIEPLFTAESYSFEATKLTKTEAKEILQRIVPRPSKPTFQLTYYSWFYGEWRTSEFYVGQGTLECRTLKENEEELENISCDMIGVNPI